MVAYSPRIKNGHGRKLFQETCHNWRKYGHGDLNCRSRQSVAKNMAMHLTDGNFASIVQASELREWAPNVLYVASNLVQFAFIVAVSLIFTAALMRYEQQLMVPQLMLCKNLWLRRSHRPAITGLALLILLLLLAHVSSQSVTSFVPLNTQVSGTLTVTILGLGFQSSDQTPSAYLSGRPCETTAWTTTTHLVCTTQSPVITGGAQTASLFSRIASLA